MWFEEKSRDGAGLFKNISILLRKNSLFMLLVLFSMAFLSAVMFWQVPETVYAASENDITANMTSSSSVNSLRMASSSKDLSVKGYGIDVSYWQGTINWDKVKADGISFAFIRVAYRTLKDGELHIDTQARRNLREANRVGIKVGVYCFSTAITQKEALEEAKFTLNIIKDYKIDYPVVYDHEGYGSKSNRNYSSNASSSSSVAKRTNNALVFLKYVESKGYKGMIYSSAGSFENSKHWDLDKLKGYDIWMAQYYYKNSSTKELYHTFAGLLSRPSWYSGTYRFWQGSSSGHISGISGGTDIDIEYYTSNSWGRESDGSVYYVANSKRVTGLQKINGKTYYFGDDGYLKYGEQEIDGSYYYFDSETGAMATHKWKTYTDDQGNSYKVRYGTDGKRLTGSHKVGSYWYFFDSSNGARLVSTWKTFRTSSGKKYKVYYNSKGRRLTGSHQIDGYRYYFNKSTGAMVTDSWKTFTNSKGKKYKVYYDSEGHRLTGSQQIGDYWYYFSENTGAMVKSKWMTFTDDEGNSYKVYYNRQGRRLSGSRTVNGKRYYFNETTGALEE